MNSNNLHNNSSPSPKSGWLELIEQSPTSMQAIRLPSLFSQKDFEAVAMVALHHVLKKQDERESGRLNYLQVRALVESNSDRIMKQFLTFIPIWFGETRS